MKGRGRPMKRCMDYVKDDNYFLINIKKGVNTEMRTDRGWMKEETCCIDPTRSAIKAAKLWIYLEQMFAYQADIYPCARGIRTHNPGVIRALVRNAPEVVEFWELLLHYCELIRTENN